MSYYHGDTYRDQYNSVTTNRFNYSGYNTEYYDIATYLKKEFFNVDNITFQNIANLYKKLYGESAYRYMRKTYNSWKSGNIRVSKENSRRILECVPKFLTNEKRFYVLKCEVVKFIGNLHSKRQSKAVDTSNVNILYENYLKEFEKFNEVNLSWFVREGIFDNSEILSFVNVCKYALYKKLQLSYRQVMNDIALIKSKFLELKIETFRAHYNIDFLNSTIDLSLISKASPNILDMSRSTIPVKLEGVFKEYTEIYLIEELLELDFIENDGYVNKLIQSNDLDFFIEQSNTLFIKAQKSSTKSEFINTGNFRGAGGSLFLHLEYKENLSKTFRRVLRNFI